MRSCPRIIERRLLDLYVAVFWIGALAALLKHWG